MQTLSASVSVITVNYNQLEVTCEMLESLRRQHYAPLEIWVVDNASQKNPATHLAAHFPEVNFIRSEINLGFAGGNNLAVPHARGKYLFFINNDTEVPADCIQKLVDFLEQHPDAGMVSPLILYHAEKNRIQYAGMTPVHPLTARNRTIGQGSFDENQFTQPQKTAYAHGAAMMIPRRVLEKVGLMHEDFFLYYEELDWCERIRRAGFEIWVEPRARLFHKESLTVGKLGALKTYFLNRNRLLFMRRNFAAWQLLPFWLFFLTVTLPKNLFLMARRGEWENLRAFLRAILWNVIPHTNPFEQLRQPAADAPPSPLFGFPILKMLF